MWLWSKFWTHAKNRKTGDLYFQFCMDTFIVLTMIDLVLHAESGLYLPTLFGNLWKRYNLFTNIITIRSLLHWRTYFKETVFKQICVIQVQAQWNEMAIFSYLQIHKSRTMFDSGFIARKLLRCRDILTFRI